ncbi:MAG TPA: GNAT family N-acetyltransferase [Oscillospiraceae bacterium]|nr:GNAT family N-acetyltransferase [Oscillospiraceae bacterium]
MAQLKMYWLSSCRIAKEKPPVGYSLSLYKNERDIMPWVECCKNGLLSDDANEKDFISRIKNHRGINLETDVIFLDFNGEHIGTVTAVFHKEENIGEVHMVGIKKEFRGKGLSKVLNSAALIKLKNDGVKYVYLTTDEWRGPAIKGYFTAGFLPVLYSTGMKERWEKVLKEHSIPKCDMLCEDGSFYMTIFASDC